MKIKNIITGLFAMLLLLAFSCTTPPAEETVDLEKIRADISTLENDWAKAANAKDSKTIVAYYADDAVTYPAHKAPTSGKSAIKAAIEKNMAMDTLQNTVKFNTTDVYAGGDYVTEVGSWKEMDASGKVSDEGNYMVLFEMRDDKYVVIRDMWNSSTPMPEAKAVTASVE